MKPYFLFFIPLFALTRSYINPVQGERDSPDPGVIYNQGFYYAVTTEGWDGHYFPIWKSQDGTNFSQVGWGITTPSSWTICCDFWAPEIHLINDKFLLYYTARDKNHKLSIGAAISNNILGPYSDKGEPLVTNTSEGVIDATVLRAGINNYIVYKVDGNAHGHDT
jgi:beta-xylosidase